MSESKLPPVCLEEALLKVFRAVFDLRLPAQACLALAVGAQAAWWLLPSAPWWLGPAAMLAAAAWVAIVWPMAQRRCGVASGLVGLATTLLHAAGIPIPPRGAALLT